MNFKIQGFFTTLIIGTVSALTISDAISQKVNAEPAPSCNNATITGSYGFKATGTIIGSPIASVGLVKVDGRGNFQSIGGASVDGTVRTNETGSGTYSVKQDCTVQIVTSDGSTYSGVIVDGGKEIVFIATVPGTVVVETWKKVN
ncbi:MULTISPECIES: hypothetical protein [unclassified Nostoc]|uniref:hypothetical protein n=1 Tax=unclassified Nostoc TaxID=2593658 RepID=UPI002AD2D2DF|nr:MULTISPECIES: hypothetical protein [unclassified Nostoc]MDZ8035011.1 hypothetical protein [Nostoc sp. DedSLP04]MDZ8130325.1 hypothetical protein [Nostoc sp. DedQUE07]